MCAHPPSFLPWPPACEPANGWPRSLTLGTRNDRSQPKPQASPDGRLTVDWCQPPAGTGPLSHLAEAMEPGSVAGVVVWENRWAAPFARAARRAGGQLIASGKIPLAAIAASMEAELDELDELEREGV